MALTHGEKELLAAVEQALAAMVHAESIVAGWCDDVRQVVEQRMGVPAADPSVRRDPTYRVALGVYGEVTRLASQARVLVDSVPAALTQIREQS